MDKFELTMQQMAKMTPEEISKMIESSKKLCICGECPTYTECSRQGKELLFCALGRSPACITEEVECICPTCPVTEQLGLVNQFFCLRGTERQQRQI